MKKLSRVQQEQMIIDVMCRIEEISDDELDEIYDELDDEYRDKLDDEIRQFADNAVGDPSWRCDDD